MDSFGNKLGITVFGESHGVMIGVVVDGVKAGMELSEGDFEADLSRRRSGAKGTTPRRESDLPQIVSGLFNGKTTGAPLTIVFRNENTRSADYAALIAHPRPSHADLTGRVKFEGMNDPRGGGHFSGRMTLCLVAAGVVAKKMLGDEVKFLTEITEIGGKTDKELFEQTIELAAKQGDSVGGVVQTTVTGIGAGRGEPFFDSVESVMSHLLFSVPAVKGVEFGSGFMAAKRLGSENNDPIVAADGTTLTNHDGGINGGITNGNPIVVRVAVKPTPSIARAQNSFNMVSGKVEELRIAGRHDACIALRAAVVVEAVCAIALAQF